MLVLTAVFERACVTWAGQWIEPFRPEASLFFRLFTCRYGCGAILITTNKSVRDWAEDEVLFATLRLLRR